MHWQNPLAKNLLLILIGYALISTSLSASATLSGYTVTSNNSIHSAMAPFIINVSYTVSSLKVTPLGVVVDPNNDARTIFTTWSWGDGSVTTGWPSGLSHTYIHAGNYTIRLTAIDDIGNVNTQISHIFVSGVTSNPFNIKLKFDRSGSKIIPNGTIKDQARNSTFISLLWSWGDGTVDSGWPKNLNHTYSAPGNYSVSIVMSDNVGNKNTYQKSVLINSNFPKPPKFVPQIRTLKVGENLTNGYITVKLENLIFLDKNGSTKAQLVVYNNGVYTNQIVVKPLTTVKVNSGGTIIYIYVGQTIFGLYNDRTAEVEVEYVQ